MSEEVQPLTETEQVEILAQPTPYHVEAFRAEDAARRTYKTTGFESVIPDNYLDGADLPADKRSAAVTNLRNMLADTGMAPVEANGLLQRAAIVRSEGKTVEQARKEARAEISRVFGADQADRALNDAKKLIQRDQRFAKWIEKKGLGNDSQTIVQIARLARSQRIAGRLK